MAADFYSMTGYGEAAAVFADLEWRCVIQSVNSRNLDIRFRLPSALNGLEIAFRKELQKVLARGKVDVSFSFVLQTAGDDLASLSADYFNSDWVAGFCASGEKILARMDWQSSDVMRAALLRAAFNQRDAFAADELKLDNLADDLFGLLHDALDLHLRSRAQEGKHLATDILGRLQVLEKHLHCISDKAAAMPDLFKDRIRERIELLIDSNQYELDQARMSQEVAHLIDKADISEEIVRFRAHIEQLSVEINESSESRKGKKLEFIVQEMLREINTIGSKANLLEITRLVVDVKNELEKIREQVQNVV